MKEFLSLKQKVEGTAMKTATLEDKSAKAMKTATLEDKSAKEWIRAWRERSGNPVEKLAVTAIKATEDNAVKEQLKNELLNMDDATKSKVANLQEAVSLKVQDMVGVT